MTKDARRQRGRGSGATASARFDPPRQENTPEFAAPANMGNGVFGATRNLWNPALSFAGSAVAVVAEMVP